MFGSRKKELESRVNDLKGAQKTLSDERDALKKQLDEALKKIDALEKNAAEMEEKLASSESEILKKELNGTIAEYEGLRELYARKNQEFDEDKETREEEFARKAAADRFNLENEIRESKESHEKYVSSTVRSFTESYNYYLNQIKLLMDALGEVAAQAGEKLFSEPEEDLKTRLGRQMAEKLKEETDPLRNDEGDLILIGAEARIEENEAGKEIEEEIEETEAEEKAEEIDAVEEAEEEIEDFEEAEGVNEETAEEIAEDVEKAETEEDY